MKIHAILENRAEPVRTNDLLSEVAEHESGKGIPQRSVIMDFVSLMDEWEKEIPEIKILDSAGTYDEEENKFIEAHIF